MRYGLGLLRSLKLFLYASLSVGVSLLLSLSVYGADKASEKFSFQGFVSELPDGAYNMRLSFKGGNDSPVRTVSSVPVKNGVFSVEINGADPNAGLTSGTFYTSTGSGDIRVQLEIETAPGNFENFGDIPLTSVGSAWVAKRAIEAGSADTARMAQGLNGITVEFAALPGAGEDGYALKYNHSAGKMQLMPDNTGSGTPMVGQGLQISGATLSVKAGSGLSFDGSNNLVVQISGPGLVNTASGLQLDVGTGAGKIPQLDGAAKLALSAIPTLSMSSITGAVYADGFMGGVTGVVNGAHIADDQITRSKIASADDTSEGLFLMGTTSGSGLVWASIPGTSPGSVGTTELANSAVTDAKVAAGISASKLTGSADLAGVSVGALSVKDQGAIQFFEGVTNGGNYLALRAPSALANTLTWTLPDVDGANGEILKFNSGTKTFYWDADAGSGGGIVGPTTTVSNGLARWNGTAGSSLKNSAVVIDDADNLTGAASITTSGLVNAQDVQVNAVTPSRVAYFDGSKTLASSSVTDTELGYLSGATANLQTQINGFSGVMGTAVAKTGDTMTGDLAVPNLKVAGAVQLADVAVTGCSPGNAGTLGYDGGVLKLCDGSSWMPLGSGGNPLDAMPLGSVHTAMSPTPPSGNWLPLNGATHATASYSSLAASLPPANFWREQSLAGTSVSISGVTQAVVTTNRIILAENSSTSRWSPIGDMFGATTNILSGPTASVKTISSDGATKVFLVSGYSPYYYFYSSDEGNTFQASTSTVPGGGSGFGSAWTGANFVMAPLNGGTTQITSYTTAQLSSGANGTNAAGSLPSYLAGLVSDGANTVLAYGSGIYRSTDDGLNFSATSIGVPIQYVAYNGTGYCALGSSIGDGAYHSGDGASWTNGIYPSVNSTSNMWLGATTNHFIAVSENSGILETYISSDCADWGAGPKISNSFYDALFYVVNGNLMFHKYSDRRKFIYDSSVFRLPGGAGDGLFRFVKY